MNITTSLPVLLLVDDDPLIAETLAFVLRKHFDVLLADSAERAMALLRAAPVAPGLALVDLGLPPDPHVPTTGFKLIGDLLAFRPDLKVVVLSGQNGEANARHARALGAIEFVAKPCAPDVILAALSRALNLMQWEGRAANAAERSALIGDSPPLQRLRGMIRQFAQTPFPVLIEGESGTGKELVARGLHDASAGPERPYLVFNCAAIAPGLAEAALFGHARGAFTGAAQSKGGYFEEAGDGTLFLDEIGELPLELQAKLLRVLETGDFQRVGETQVRYSRARIVAATNRDLREESRQGRFRADLYHRLSVFTIDMPPLRELGADKMLLLAHFRERYVQQAGLPPFELDDSAKQAWLDYPFPGNVRELRNIVIRLTAKYPGRTIGQAELQGEFDLVAPPLHQLVEAAVKPAAARTEPPLVERAMAELQAAPGFSLDGMLKAWERGYIEAAMRLANGNVSQAAKLLGINRTTLYGRIGGEQKLS